jgi:hypothetical protein
MHGSEHCDLVDRISMLTVALIIASAFSAFGLARVFADVMMLFSGVGLDGPALPIETADESAFASFYRLTPYIAPLAWAVFFALAMWKGAIRKLWTARGYDYEAFRIFAKMRGSDARVKILKSLQDPKSRMQLANELAMHWESVNDHVKILIKYELVRETGSIGTTKYLTISEKGKEIVALVEKAS